MTSGVDYYRLGDSSTDIDKIQWGRKLRGREPRNIYASHILKVKAYVGTFPKGKQGFDFLADFDADLGTPPNIALWSHDARNPLCRVRLVSDNGTDFAEIDCDVTRRSV